MIWELKLLVVRFFRGANFAKTVFGAFSMQYIYIYIYIRVFPVIAVSFECRFCVCVSTYVCNYVFFFYIFVCLVCPLTFQVANRVSLLSFCFRGLSGQAAAYSMNTLWPFNYTNCCSKIWFSDIFTISFLFSMYLTTNLVLLLYIPFVFDNVI